jgi:hypothetical protein
MTSTANRVARTGIPEVRMPRPGAASQAPAGSAEQGVVQDVEPDRADVERPAVE